VRHPESLLFIDHQQPELLEVHVLGQQTMRAHHDIDRSGAQTAHHRILLALGLEPRQRTHLDRVAAKARLERDHVLLREHRGGAQHRDLA
jgi:hypothetical protein